MGEKYYCHSCGNEYEECNCDDVFEDELNKETFRWEFQHESISMYGSRFKRIMPDYDD